MATIFEISSEFERALQEAEDWCLDHGTDELPDEITERLAINQNELDDKLKGYYHKINEFEMKAQLIANEVKRLNGKKKAYTANVERMKAFVFQAVERFGTPTKSGYTYKGAELKTTIRRSNKLEIVNAELIPKQYTTTEVKEVVKYDSKAIKAALVAGESIDGAAINDRDHIITFS